MNKDLENKKLRLALYKETVKSARIAVTNCEAEYEKIRQRIEQDLGMSIKDCVIDEVTFEVKSLEEETN